jgi:hypothetical protein
MRNMPPPLTVLKLVRSGPEGDILVASSADAAIVGLAALLLADALAARRDRDPVVAALRSGQRRALRHLVEATP